MEHVHGPLLMSDQQVLATRSEWRGFPLLTTITFLGQRADITGPRSGGA